MPLGQYHRFVGMKQVPLTVHGCPKVSALVLQASVFLQCFRIHGSFVHARIAQPQGVARELQFLPAFQKRARNLSTSLRGHKWANSFGNK